MVLTRSRRDRSRQANGGRRLGPWQCRRRRASQRSTYPTPSQPSSGIQNPRQTARKRSDEITIRVGRNSCTAHNINQLLVCREPRGSSRQRDTKSRTRRPNVCIDGNHLRTGVALAHDNGAAIVEDGVRVVRQVAGVLADGAGADLVELGDPGVEVRGGVVVGEPEGFAVVWHAAAGVVLFLALVDDGDACGGLVSGFRSWTGWEGGSGGAPSLSIVNAMAYKCHGVTLVISRLEQLQVMSCLYLHSWPGPINSDTRSASSRPTLRRGCGGLPCRL